MPKKSTRKRRQHSYELPCILFPVTVKIVSQAYLNKAVQKRKLDPKTVACYADSENTIYIARGQSPADFMHSLWHEVKHAFDAHVKAIAVNSEPKDIRELEADLFGVLMMALFPNMKPSDVLRERK